MSTEVIDLTSATEKYAIEVPGQPKALPRSRHFHNGFFHGARREMKVFKSKVREAIPETASGPLYARGVPVQMEVKFYMRRPNSDFRGGRRTGGVLRSLLPNARPIRPDIDNLAKFVLDASNGLFYDDDRQVVKLTLYKLLDNAGECEGRTVIHCSECES